VQRILFAAAAVAMTAPTGAAMAQKGADSMKNHVNDTIARKVQHWHFDGKVSTIDPGARRITINADSIPQQMGGQTTLPYQVPASVSFDSFHEGDRVNGDLVVRNNRTRVENVKLGPTPARHPAKSRPKRTGGSKAAVDHDKSAKTEVTRNPSN